MTTVVAVVEQSTLVRPGTQVLSLFSRAKILLLLPYMGMAQRVHVMTHTTLKTL